MTCIIGRSFIYMVPGIKSLAAAMTGNSLHIVQTIKLKLTAVLLYSEPAEHWNCFLCAKISCDIPACHIHYARLGFPQYGGYFLLLVYSCPVVLLFSSAVFSHFSCIIVEWIVWPNVTKFDCSPARYTLVHGSAAFPNLYLFNRSTVEVDRCGWVVVSLSGSRSLIFQWLEL